MNNNLVKIIDKEEIKLFVENTTLKWYVFNQENNIFYDLNENSNMTPVLKILYNDPDIFFNDLKDQIYQMKLNPELTESFPLIQVANFCIKNHLYFWLRLLVRWSEHIPPNMELKKKILNLQKEKYPQDIKHLLLKLINDE